MVTLTVLELLLTKCKRNSVALAEEKDVMTRIAKVKALQTAAREALGCVGGKNSSALKRDAILELVSNIEDLGKFC